jgi:hypothetical protein
MTAHLVAALLPQRIVVVALHDGGPLGVPGHDKCHDPRRICVIVDEIAQLDRVLTTLFQGMGPDSFNGLPVGV